MWVSVAWGPFEVGRSNPADPGLPQGTPGVQASPFPQKHYLAPTLTGPVPELQVTQDHSGASWLQPGVLAAAPGEGSPAAGLGPCPPCAPLRGPWPFAQCLASAPDPLPSPPLSTFLVLAAVSVLEPGSPPLTSISPCQPFLCSPSQDLCLSSFPHLGRLLPSFRSSDSHPLAGAHAGSAGLGPHPGFSSPRLWGQG